MCHQVSFWGTPTQADIIESQLKNQRSESKTLYGFYNKNGMESKLKNPLHSLRETNVVLQLM